MKKKFHFENDFKNATKSKKLDPNFQNLVDKLFNKNEDQLAKEEHQKRIAELVGSPICE